jgi:diacylglycerol kinase family enzyme
MSHWVAIVNPRSGGASRPAILRIVQRLQTGPNTVVRTEYPGHATAIAREAHQAEGIVAIGGDGTISEVLQGIDLDRQTLALVPAGRGNSLCRDLGWRPKSALHVAENHARMDLMRIVFHTSDGNRRTLLSASTIALGYPAAVASLANRRFRSAGSACYAAAGACAVPSRTEISIAYNGKISEVKVVTGLLISNTRHAANFTVFPAASCCDGSIEAMELRAGYLSQSLHNLSTLSGVPLRRPPAIAGVARVSLTCVRPQTLLVDGELFSHVASVDVCVLPSALSVSQWSNCQWSN